MRARRWVIGVWMAVWWAMLCVGTEARAAATPADGPALVAHVFALLDERLSLMPSVAAAKWLARAQVSDPARERDVLDAFVAQASRLGLEAVPAARLMTMQMQYARELQASRFQAWTLGTVTSPTSAPGLATELRPRLDDLSHRLLRALYLAAPWLDSTDLERLARSSLPDDRWTEEQRRSVTEVLRTLHLQEPRSLARAQRAGVLRIGTPGDYAPFAWVAADELRGAEVDLAGSLAQSLGLEAVFVRTRWSDLTADLAHDRFDLAVGGISVTEARRAVASFSRPLVRGGKTAIGRCTDAAPLSTLKAIDQPGVRVIENAGGTNESFARKTLHSASLRIHPDNVTVFDEITSGRADVMFTDDTEIALLVRQRPSLCRLLTDRFDEAEKAFLLPGDHAFDDAVDRWIVPVIAAGTPAALINRYQSP